MTSNGGSATLSDTPGGGLTVTVDLPEGQPDRARWAGLAATGRDLPLLPGDSSAGRALATAEPRALAIGPGPPSAGAGVSGGRFLPHRG